MQKEMQSIKVYTDLTGDNIPVIVICQPLIMQDDQFIYIHPEQADIIIQWIKDAKDELDAKG